MFSKDDIEAFATTQVILLDTRTALVPFTFVSTKDALGQKINLDVDLQETRKRIQSEAVNLTIEDIGEKLVEF